MRRFLRFALLAGLLQLGFSVFFLGKDLLVFFLPEVPAPQQRTAQDLFPGTGTRPTAEDFDPVEMLDERPAITDVQPIPADQITNEVELNELVLGVVIHGESRCYPINAMTTPSREVFNDILAGQPIAATW